MGVNSLPKTVTRQRRGSDLNPDPNAPESSTLTSFLCSSWWLGSRVVSVLDSGAEGPGFKSQLRR